MILRWRLGAVLQCIISPIPNLCSVRMVIQAAMLPADEKRSLGEEYSISITRRCFTCVI